MHIVDFRHGPQARHDKMKNGQVFEIEGSVYIKTTVLNKSVNLNTGNIVYFTDSTMVNPVDAEVIIQKGQ